MSALDDFLDDAGIGAAGAETLIRLAVCIVTDGLDEALASFSEPDEVVALAKRVEQRLYGHMR